MLSALPSRGHASGLQAQSYSVPVAMIIKGYRQKARLVLTQHLIANMVQVAK